MLVVRHKNQNWNLPDELKNADKSNQNDCTND